MLNPPGRRRAWPPRLSDGAASPSIITFTQAGSPERAASASAAPTSPAVSTRRPNPPNAAHTSS